MAVRIVTDSTSDLLTELARELEISIVPLSVIFGQEAYREGLDINHDEFYRRLVQKKALPTTSAPSTGDFLAKYEELLEQGHEIVSIHLSSRLSATFNNATQAAVMLKERGRIEVVDSRLITMGMSFMVIAAARAALAGRSIEDVRKVAEGISPRVDIYFLVDTLEYLRRGGRIGRAQAMLGAMLQFKPLLALKDGEVHPHQRLRTRKQAMARLIEIVTSQGKLEEVCVGYSTNREDTETLRGRLQKVLPGVKVDLIQVGPVIGAHCGPGILGVGLLRAER